MQTHCRLIHRVLLAHLYRDRDVLEVYIVVLNLGSKRDNLELALQRLVRKSEGQITLLKDADF